MDYKEVASVLEELRVATESLFPAVVESDLDFADMANRLAVRRSAVDRVGRLVERSPKSFTPGDLEQIQAAQSKGKRALESVLDLRRQKLAVKARAERDQYYLRTVPAGD